MSLRRALYHCCMLTSQRCSRYHCRVVTSLRRTLFAYSRAPRGSLRARAVRGHLSTTPRHPHAQCSLRTHAQWPLRQLRRRPSRLPERRPDVHGQRVLGSDVMCVCRQRFGVDECLPIRLHLLPGSHVRLRRKLVVSFHVHFYFLCSFSSTFMFILANFHVHSRQLSCSFSSISLECPS